MEPAAELTDVHKHFGSVTALQGARLELRPGEIHALLGQNGAGKTTLGRILAGLTRPDGGHIRVQGSEVGLRSPSEARRRGIAMVHQHFSLVPRFTGLDNIRLFNEEAWGPAGLRRPDYEDRILERARALDLTVVLDRPVETLSVGDRQRLELIKALMSETRILILDEPTAVLTPAEVDGLFHVLRNLAGQGAAICLIAHKLDEVMAVADRVTVLRDGAWILTKPAGQLTRSDLVAAMMGTDPAGALDRGPGEPRQVPAGEPRGEAVARLEDVSVGPSGSAALHGISLEVRRGEVLGVAGVEGNGQRELASVLAGVRNPDGGRVKVPERVGWIPQDRSTEGLIAEFSLTENVALALHSHPAYATGWRLDWPKLRATTERVIADLGVRATGPSSPAMVLSGGNQQKVLTARELERGGDLLVAESPTRGLDIGAAAVVHSRIREMVRRETPAGVVLISTDLDEILDLADRIMVLVRGRLIPLPAEARDRGEIGRVMLTGEPA